MIQSIGKTGCSYSHRCLNLTLLSCHNTRPYPIQSCFALDAIRWSCSPSEYTAIVSIYHIHKKGSPPGKSSNIRLSRLTYRAYAHRIPRHTRDAFLPPTPRAADSSFLYFPNRAETAFHPILSAWKYEVNHSLFHDRLHQNHILLQENHSSKLSFPIDILRRRHAPSDNNRTEYTKNQACNEYIPENRFHYAPCRLHIHPPLKPWWNSIHLHHHFQTVEGISSARYLKFYHPRCICVNHRPSFRYKWLTFHNPYHKNDSCQDFLAQHINFMTSRAQF